MSQPDHARASPCPTGVEQVKVPAYAGTLAPPVRDRIRRLRRNLVEAMRDERALPSRQKRAATTRDAPEPAGFVGQVARAACALCQGWCCSKGGEHAYLDGPSMARIRAARPELDAWGILRLYTRAVADPAYAGSCVFHGAQGCTLERGLRANLCNRYFCDGLGALAKRDSVRGPVVVVATRGDVSRTSATLAEEPSANTSPDQPLR